MGFVILGLAARNDTGITGAILQMFNHGVISAMLFLLVGVLYDRAHHREINGFGGLGTRMPVYTGITTLAFMASLGLPRLKRIRRRGTLLTRCLQRIQVVDHFVHNRYCRRCRVLPLDTSEGLLRKSQSEV